MFYLLLLASLHSFPVLSLGFVDLSHLKATLNKKSLEPGACIVSLEQKDFVKF